MNQPSHLVQSLAGLQFRADDNNPCFRGHAAVFYNASDPQTEYWIWWDYVERLAPGCFDRALNDNDDTRHLFNHDANKLLGRRSANTLEMGVDATGLYFSSPYDESDPDHVSYRAKILRGDLQGCSFSFSRDGTSSTWEEIPHPTVPDETLWIRTITEVGFLYDVGGVTFPAYEGTDVEFNSKFDMRNKPCRALARDQNELVEARSVLKSHQGELEAERQRRFREQIEFDYQFRTKQQNQ